MKLSQLDRAIAALKADRAVLDLAIAKLEAQQVVKAASKQPKVSKRRRGNGEGAMTDSGNMNYPPA